MQESKRLILNRILISLLVVFFCAVFFLPSVLNKNPQIQSKLLITAIGIDQEQDQVEFSGVCIFPDNGEQAKVKSLTVTSKAPTIAECVELISEQYGKQAELGLCGLIVIGESTDKKSILPHLEFLLSSAFVSPGTYIIYASEGKASKLLEYASKQNPSTAEILSSVVEFNDKTARITTKTLLEFLSETYSKSSSSVIPSVKVAKGESEEQSKVMNSLTTAVVYKNGQNVGTLNEEQTLGLNLATLSADKGLLSVDNVVLDNQNIGRIDCWIYSSKSKTKVKFENGVPIANIDVKVVLQFQDQHKIIRAWKQSGKKESEITQPLLSCFQDKITQLVLNAFTKSQELNADIFELQPEFFRYCTQDFLSMTTNDFLNKVQPKINVKVSFK